MAKKSKVGDVFEVKLDESRYAYLQYIANDMTQLNSDVVRVFKQRYSKTKKEQLDEVIDDEIEFYAHVTGLDIGEKDGSWTKVGNVADVGDLSKPFFRGTRDTGDPSIRISKRWYVWKINEPTRYVGKLTGEDIAADIGSILPPSWIVKRIQSGKYQFFYHNY